MPNATAAAARRAKKAAATKSNEDGPIVTATQEVNGFTIEALGDYQFTRPGAGRRREPSPFDDVVESLVGQGTQRIPVADEEAGTECVKQLQKATDFRERGLEKRIEQNEGGEWFVIFRVNEEKAKRAPRKVKANGESEGDLTDAAEDAETE